MSALLPASASLWLSVSLVTGEEVRCAPACLCLSLPLPLSLDRPHLCLSL